MPDKKKTIGERLDEKKRIEETYETKYAIVDAFKIDKEGHGILTMHFGMNYDDGWHQGVGGYMLDDVIKDEKGEFVRRTDDSKAFLHFLMWVYEEFDCDDYANLQKDVVGKPCIVYFEKGKKRESAVGLKPFGKDRPMIFKEFLSEYYPEDDQD